jgi:DNA-binding MarR family transcriptional regulator
MTDIELERFFPYRLNRIADAVSQRFRRIYRDRFGLTVPEWRVLATLGQFRLITAKEVGQHSGMHKTKVSRAVAEIERRRWLKRQTSPVDRREEILMLTAEGRRAYASIVPGMLACERDLFAALGASHARSVLQAVRQLEAILGLKTQRSLDRDTPRVRN